MTQIATLPLQLLSAQAALGPNGKVYLTGPGILELDPESGESIVLVSPERFKPLGAAIAVSPANRIWTYGGLVIDEDGDGSAEWRNRDTATSFLPSGAEGETKPLPSAGLRAISALTVARAGKWKTLLAGGVNQFGAEVNFVGGHSGVDSRDTVNDLGFHLPVPGASLALGYARGTVFAFGFGNGDVVAIHRSGAMNLGPIGPARKGMAVAEGPAPDTLLVIGGHDGNACYGDVWLFDARSLSMEKVDDSLPPLAYAAAVRVGDRVLTVGGRDYYRGVGGDAGKAVHEVEL